MNSSAAAAGAKCRMEKHGLSGQAWVIHAFSGPLGSFRASEFLAEVEAKV